MNGTTARFRKRILKLPDVVESPGIFSEADAFWVNGTQIAHFHGDDAVKLRLTRGVIRAQRARLRADPRAELRAPSSDWLLVRLDAPGDVAFALELTELAAAAHRAAAGVTPVPPPQGAELARRRRFH